MHSAIVGMSRSGKTTLAQMIARGLVKRGRAVAVFDPLRDPNWQKTGAECVADPFELLHRAKTSTCRHFFWEEWGPYLRHHPDPEVRKRLPAFAWLGQSSRQLGHTQWFLSHSWQDLLHVRGQCDQAFCFAQGNKSACLIAEDFARGDVAGFLPAFPRLRFMLLRKMAEKAAIGTIDFTGRGPRLRWEKSKP
jgi:hypothetical protein